MRNSIFMYVYYLAFTIHNNILKKIIRDSRKYFYINETRESFIFQEKKCHVKIRAMSTCRLSSKVFHVFSVVALECVQFVWNDFCIRTFSSPTEMRNSSLEFKNFHQYSCFIIEHVFCELYKNLYHIRCKLLLYNFMKPLPSKKTGKGWEKKFYLYYCIHRLYYCRHNRSS